MASHYTIPSFASRYNAAAKTYEMTQQSDGTYALTRICTFVLTGQAMVSSLNDGAVKDFWETGTNLDRTKRFKNVDEVMNAIRQMTESDVFPK